MKSWRLPAFFVCTDGGNSRIMKDSRYVRIERDTFLEETKQHDKKTK